MKNTGKQRTHVDLGDQLQTSSAECVYPPSKGNCALLTAHSDTLGLVAPCVQWKACKRCLASIPLWTALLLHKCCSPLQHVTNPMPTRAARVSRYVRSKNLFSVFRTTSGLVPVKARRGYPTPMLGMAVIHHVGAGY